MEVKILSEQVFDFSTIQKFPDMSPLHLIDLTPIFLNPLQILLQNSFVHLLIGLFSREFTGDHQIILKLFKSTLGKHFHR
jgi:hypothetical protein